MEVRQATRVGRPSWVNVRTSLGLLLFAAALLTGNRVLASANTTIDVWAAARDLPEGTKLVAGDLRPAAVKLPARLLPDYVRTSRPLDGVVLTRPVHGGELIPLGWLAAEGDRPDVRAMAIPIEPEHAVGGALRPGDRVDVLATFDASDARARTTVLARGVDVLEVVRTEGITLGDDVVTAVTLAVDAQDAVRLAFAVRTAELDVVRVDGPPGPDPGGSTVTGRDFR